MKRGIGCKHAKNGSGKRGGQSKKHCSVCACGNFSRCCCLSAHRFWRRNIRTAYDALRIVGDEIESRRGQPRHLGHRGRRQSATGNVESSGRGQARARRCARESKSRMAGSFPNAFPLVPWSVTAEGATINTAHLNLDSSGAFSVASRTAEKSYTHFATVSYTLRTDERGDPIWIVTLENESRKPVGTIHIGANRGTVTRTEGMFDGAPWTGRECGGGSGSG